jgi:hypothetical protein
MCTSMYYSHEYLSDRWFPVLWQLLRLWGSVALPLPSIILTSLVGVKANSMVQAVHSSLVMSKLSQHEIQS